MSEELQETAKYYEMMNYKDTKVIIKSNINSVVGNFVAIGYYLKHIRDKEMFKEDGYQNIWDLAQAEFGISKSQASKFMAINDRFSKDGNSPILLEQYKEFSSSKLSEMLYLTNEQLEQVTVGTTVAQIREIKNPEKVVSTSKQEPETKPSYLKCTAYDFHKFKEGCSECFYDMTDCPYDRTEYFAEIKRQEEWKIHCEVLKEMCDCICNMMSYILEENNYSMDTIKSLSRDDQEFSFGFGDNGVGHSRYMATCKSERYHVEEFDGTGKWIFEAGEVDQQIWNVNGNTWRFKQHEAKKSEPVTDHPEIVDNKPDIVNDVDETVIKTLETVIKEPESVVETVEAEIIQTVPDELPKPIFSAEYHLREAIKREEDQLKQLGETWLIKQPDTYLKHQTILIALKCHLTDMEYPIPEPVKPVQPELPVLKNNDQRKEFIDAYATWPIWIDMKETGERYYRYDLTDKVAMVVKVSKQHIHRNYKETKDIDYGAEQYYLLGIKAEWHQTGVVYTEDATRTFYECSSNKSQMVDYLKYFQKKGVH